MPSTRVVIRVSLLAVLSIIFGLDVQAATLRQKYAHSAVFLSCGQESGSGFLFFHQRGTRADGRATGRVLLATAAHLVPPRAGSCSLKVRVSRKAEVQDLVTLDLPSVKADGSLEPSVRIHPTDDVAVIDITSQIASAEVEAEFVDTGLLGTRAKLGTQAALVGDNIYVIGFPGGVYDTRDASPIWRLGILGTDPRRDYSFPEYFQKTFGVPATLNGFLIDAQIFPGSSGSAVVIKPEAISFDSPSGLLAGGARSITYVLGINSGSMPIVDGALRLVSRMGLGMIVSADAVESLIQSLFPE